MKEAKITIKLHSEKEPEIEFFGDMTCHRLHHIKYALQRAYNRYMHDLRTQAQKELTERLRLQEEEEKAELQRQQLREVLNTTEESEPNDEQNNDDNAFGWSGQSTITESFGRDDSGGETETDSGKDS